jgi:hypothetical protein
LIFGIFETAENQKIAACGSTYAERSLAGFASTYETRWRVAQVDLL